MATLVALCSSLLKKPLRGGLVIIGEINLGGSIEPVHNAVTLVEMAVEKGAQAVLMPVASRRQLFDLSDDMATKVDAQFYLVALHQVKTPYATTMTTGLQYARRPGPPRAVLLTTTTQHHRREALCNASSPWRPPGSPH